MSILAIAGLGPGEKGVNGVPGPVVLVVPAEVRLRMRLLVLMGLMMLEEPDVRDDFDCEDERVGCGFSAAFGALSLLENRPMSVLLYVDVVSVVRQRAQSASDGRSAVGSEFGRV